MKKIIVDGTEIEVPDHYTLMQAAEQAGAEIPRFCYHERLSIAGNCRMCLVEVKGGPPKPQASCALAVADLRPGPNGEPPEMFTNTPMVKKAREGVMEFLLINHPLDCPICDQGGECDLQDQAMAFGIDKNRFAENKRSVEDKDIGPLIKTTMTRCIHCTRCVRFTTEVAGISEMGLTGRGEDAEITTYLSAALTSELQGNVIDLCPVGALTSKPYEFSARPWELNKTESIDVMDALGSAIRVDSRGREVMRVMPLINEAINEEWISDKSRFIWDGLKSQRLDRPYVRKSGKLQEATWDEAFSAIARKVKASKPNRIGAIAGDLSGVEELYALKGLMDSLGVSNIDCRQDGAAHNPKNGRASYLFNTTIQGIEDADAILIIGANPRLEASVLNARIRKTWRKGGAVIGVVGEAADLTYDYDHLGTGSAALQELASGKGSFAKLLKKAKRPMIIVGQSALTGNQGATHLGLAATIADKFGAATKDWNGFNVLHNAAGRVGALDIGFVPGKGGKSVATMLADALKGNMDVMFLAGADEINTEALGKTFTVYIGTHGDAGAHAADVILPGATYTEKSATYVNTEGRPQQTTRAIFAPGDAKEDWAIYRALSAKLGKPLAYDTLQQLRAALYGDHPPLANLGSIASIDGREVGLFAKTTGKTTAKPFAPAFDDFYLTNPIARASATMAECSQLRTATAIAAE